MEKKKGQEDEPEEKKEGTDNSLIGVGAWDEGDDEEGWITPDNIEEYTASFTEVISEGGSNELKVACLTLDFSMQNVLLQMNMNLISVDGMTVKSSQRWIRRCYACHQLVKEMDIIYCKQCGSTSLQKISYTVDKDGSATYHIPRRNRSLRGLKYPIPQPKPGQRSKFIVSPQQLPKTKKRKEDLDLHDPDAIFMNDRRGVTPHQGAVLGYGKKNPNEARRKIGKKNKSKGRDT